MRDLFAEMTETHNAEAWLRKELAAFDDEPDTQPVDLEAEGVTVIHVRDRPIRFGQLRQKSQV